MIEIDKKIVGFEVKSENTPMETTPAIRERGETLSGHTYKIKGGAMKHSYYITINDSPKGVPFEIFIASQDTEHYQWISSLTRMISAVFRRADDVSFVVEELKTVVDPAGGLGFIKLVGMKKPRMIPSLPAAIGYILEYHVGRVKKKKKEPVAVEVYQGDYPDSATVCKSCGEKAVIVMDGCATCLACSDSKCG